MHACAARLQFAAARDEGERMVGKTWRRTRGSGRRPPCSSSAVHAQATAWEHERRTRVNARRAELETLLGTVGTEITLKVADVALKDDADQSLHPRMRTRLSRGRGNPWQRSRERKRLSPTDTACFHYVLTWDCTLQAQFNLAGTVKFDARRSQHVLIRCSCSGTEGTTRSTPRPDR